MAGVLVVDDEDVLLAMIAALLEDLGHDAITALNGFDALSELAAREQPPALIISDVMMPRMSGVTLMQEIRGDPRLRDVPVILMSAGGRPRDIGGADYFLSKPFDLDELSVLIERHVGGVEAEA
jgi:CheY-like chemotaxis protein